MIGDPETAGLFGSGGMIVRDSIAGVAGPFTKDGWNFVDFEDYETDPPTPVSFVGRIKPSVTVTAEVQPLDGALDDSLFGYDEPDIEKPVADLEEEKEEKELYFTLPPLTFRPILDDFREKFKGFDLPALTIPADWRMGIRTDEILNELSLPQVTAKWEEWKANFQTKMNELRAQLPSDFKWDGDSGEGQSLIDMTLETLNEIKAGEGISAIDLPHSTLGSTTYIFQKHGSPDGHKDGDMKTYSANERWKLLRDQSFDTGDFWHINWGLQLTKTINLGSVDLGLAGTHSLGSKTFTVGSGTQLNGIRDWIHSGTSKLGAGVYDLVEGGLWKDKIRGSINDSVNDLSDSTEAMLNSVIIGNYADPLSGSGNGLNGFIYLVHKHLIGDEENGLIGVLTNWEEKLNLLKGKQSEMLEKFSDLLGGRDMSVDELLGMTEAQRAAAEASLPSLTIGGLEELFDSIMSDEIGLDGKPIGVIPRVIGGFNLTMFGDGQSAMGFADFFDQLQDRIGIGLDPTKTEDAPAYEASLIGTLNTYFSETLADLFWNDDYLTAEETPTEQPGIFNELVNYFAHPETGAFAKMDSQINIWMNGEGGVAPTIRARFGVLGELLGDVGSIYTFNANQSVGDSITSMLLRQNRPNDIGNFNPPIRRVSAEGFEVYSNGTPTMPLTVHWSATGLRQMESESWLDRLAVRFGRGEQTSTL